LSVICSSFYRFNFCGETIEMLLEAPEPLAIQTDMASSPREFGHRNPPEASRDAVVRFYRAEDAGVDPALELDKEVRVLARADVELAHERHVEQVLPGPDEVALLIRLSSRGHGEVAVLGIGLSTKVLQHIDVSVAGTVSIVIATGVHQQHAPLTSNGREHCKTRGPYGHVATVLVRPKRGSPRRVACDRVEQLGHGE
jgi:hypothetical protein